MIYLDQPVNLYHNQLVERCRNGDARSFGDLYQQYAKAMYSTCFRLLNNATEAEDILQDAFIDAFRHLDDFQQRSSFGAWLKKIVVNRCLNHLKKKKLNLVYAEGGQMDELAMEQEDPGEENIEYRVAEVKKAIQLLPDGYRAVLSLYLLEGYDHEEIAAILGVAESTTRTQYIRAKKKLVDIIKNQLS